MAGCTRAVQGVGCTSKMGHWSNHRFIHIIVPVALSVSQSAHTLSDEPKI